MIRHTGIFFAIFLYGQFCAAAEYVFSASPTESRELSQQVYQPIADFLSEVTGKNVVYRYPGNWPVYMRNMQQAKYDFVIDTPHFVSWRVEKIEHRPLISLAENLVYVVVTKGDAYQSLYDLQGKTACSSAIPNLDALTLMDQFDSVWTQPNFQVIRGFTEKATDLLETQCHAVVLPERVYLKMVKTENPRETKALFRSQVLPHLALSVSPRINLELGNRIQTAMLSPDADSAFGELTKLYGLDGVSGSKRIAVDADDYRGYAYLLAEYWGF